jgi:hypothetical protein
MACICAQPSREVHRAAAAGDDAELPTRVRKREAPREDNYVHSLRRASWSLCDEENGAIKSKGR